MTPVPGGRAFGGRHSRVGWDDWEYAALRGGSFCLPSACRDAPLGQRQGGVFRVPPPYLWTPPTPQRAKGCSPLTILKKKSKHKKASAAPVGAIALTLFSLLHLKPLSRCATAPPRGSEHARTLCTLAGNFPAMPRAPSLRGLSSECETGGVFSVTLSYKTAKRPSENVNIG